jgi:hypothetical protein
MTMMMILCDAWQWGCTDDDRDDDETDDVTDNVTDDVTDAIDDRSLQMMMML